jgi:hypothetical protein
VGESFSGKVEWYLLVNQKRFSKLKRGLYCFQFSINVHYIYCTASDTDFYMCSCLLEIMWPATMETQQFVERK